MKLVCAKVASGTESREGKSLVRPLREAMEAEGKLEVGNWHRQGGRDRAWGGEGGRGSGGEWGGGGGGRGISGGEGGAGRLMHIASCQYS